MDLGESPTFRVTVFLVLGRSISFFKITSCKNQPENGLENINQGLAVLTYQARMCRTAQDPWQNCFPQRSGGWQAIHCMKSGCYLLLHDPWAKGGFYIWTPKRKSICPTKNSSTFLINRPTLQRKNFLIIPCMCVCMLSHVWLFVTPWTVACQAPLSIEFSTWEYWSGLPFPTPGDLPDLGIEPTSPALEDGFFATKPCRPRLLLIKNLFLYVSI